jgi:hypothetical protein
VTTISFVSIASQGNSNNYGDLRTAAKYGAGTSNSVKGLYGAAGSGAVNVIDQFQISTGGTCTDFGDLSVSRQNISSGQISQAHGGLNDGYQGARP